MSIVYLYPPTSVSVAFPPGAASETTQLLVLAQLQAINTNQHLPVIGMASLDFSVSNVTDAAWVQLAATVGAAAVKKVQIFMSSGEPLLLAFGAAASEVSTAFILPGGNGFIDLEIPANTRLSLRAVNAVTVNSGVILVNLLG